MRGQINQVFTFLMAIIVVVALIYIGGRLFGLFGKTACDLAASGFEDDLRLALDEHATFGSRGDITLDPPCGAVSLCLVDSGANGKFDFTSEDPVVQNIVRSGVQTNIFLSDGEQTSGAGYDKRIIVGRKPTEPLGTTQYVCVQNKGRGFVLHTEGFGNAVRVG